mmetsp:Transcript_70943/g.213406  ORF Transcript_70943/g.213406 Transcript_70943/m.213406 type:complete len:82 (-) Transcript_70943:7-252(-)|eukprot:3780762-Prymnesium_polylepis.2
MNGWDIKAVHGAVEAATFTTLNAKGFAFGCFSECRERAELCEFPTEVPARCAVPALYDTRRKRTNLKRTTNVSVRLAVKRF